MFFSETNTVDIAPGSLNREIVELLAANVGCIYETHLQWFAHNCVFLSSWVTMDTSSKHTIFLQPSIQNPLLYF